jgi:hypothetical protein
MSNPIELLPGTSIAATSWLDDQMQLRVYTQDIEGNIRESRYSYPDGWTGGTSKDIVVKAKPNSPLAAISFFVDMMGAGYYYAVRVYYISPDNILCERRLDGGSTWTAGDLDALNIEASPVSRLEAINSASGSGADISIFYQRPDGALGNIYWNWPIPIPQEGDFPSGWVDNGIVGRKPLFGTGLAAVPFRTGDPDTNCNKLFYQLPDGQLAEADVDWAGKWSEGDLPKITDAAVATNISGWGYGSPPTSFRLFYLANSNSPVERVYSNNQWGHPKPAGDFIPVPGSDLSIIQLKTADELRLYIQDENNVIQEYGWSKGQTEWSKDTLIPVGELQ